jgi:hypothetical protein
VMLSVGTAKQLNASLSVWLGQLPEGKQAGWCAGHRVHTSPGQNIFANE